MMLSIECLVGCVCVCVCGGGGAFWAKDCLNDA